MGLGLDKFNGLKSLNRIDGMIDKGYIKRIYVDGWSKNFIKKIDELFGYKVNVIEIKYNSRIIDKIEFTKNDCLLLDDDINLYKKYDYLIKKAKHNEVFIKILTEDIYNIDYLCDSRAKEIERELNINNNGMDLKQSVLEIKDEWLECHSIEYNFKVVTRNEYALTRLKDGRNVELIETEWYKISKGHNFVLKLGDMYYSVDYLNRVLEV